MGKKILLISLLLLSFIGGYSLVFASNLIFTSDIQLADSTSKDIYIDDEDLSSAVVVYNSNIDISGYTFSSSCQIDTEFVTAYKTLYFFEVKFQNIAPCRNGNIVLESSQGKIASSIMSFNIHQALDDIEVFIDYSSKDLDTFQNYLGKDLKKYSIYKNYNNTDIARNYKLLKGQRKYKETLYKNSIIDEILTLREKKYIVPVAGGKISEQHSKVPNAGRPYRESYTDGIHHGWDVPGDFGQEVIALDDGIIVRVVRDFSDSDFSRINYNTDSKEQKLKNLDILRGNQVWLKTMKGEVIFYSHLDDIPLNIQEGIYTTRGETLGTMGISGVPEKGYDDYHLHFAVMENPYNADTAGTYDFGDYMAWDWKLRDMGYNEIITAQKEIFE